MKQRIEALKTIFSIKLIISFVMEGYTRSKHEHFLKKINRSYGKKFTSEQCKRISFLEEEAISLSKKLK